MDMDREFAAQEARRKLEQSRRPVGVADFLDAAIQQAATDYTYCSVCGADGRA